LPSHAVVAWDKIASSGAAANRYRIAANRARLLSDAIKLGVTMPSPFPGMDPYLEGQLWMGFHGDLCTQIKWQLAPQLEPKYYPFTKRYLMRDSSASMEIAADIIPDVGVSEAGDSGLPASAGSVLAAPLQMRTLMPVPVPHYRIEIRDVQNRQLVTAIEFLSPTNKRKPGRRIYLRKRERILASSSHLVEIDLLRKGQRVPMEEPYPQDASYFVLVSREQKRPSTDVWPISITQPLPSIPIPLLAPDPDVALNLQEALDKIYDQGRYRGVIDYKMPPDVKLTAEQERWADLRLREMKLRP
jgi:hypothetical protein